MKYAIDYGHCLRGADTGAVGNGLKEQEVTREVGRLVTNKLRAQGHTVIEVATDSASNVTESLQHRCNVANNDNVDMFVSIHVNAGGGLGTEIYTYRGEEVKEARNVLNNLVQLGFRNRGIKDGSNLYVIRNTKAKSMLVELFFIDSTSDVGLYKRLGANGLANGIIKGLTSINTSTPQKSTQKATETIKTNGEIYGRHNLIRELQQEINRQGFGSIAIDGVAGDNTIKACPLCKQGARGNITRIIQKMLINIGYPIGAYGTDGVYGNGTVTAVKAFQRDCRLNADGIVGASTWKALFRNLK